MTAPAVLAAQLVRADAALHAHVTVDAALAQQRLVLRLSDNPALARAVIRLLPAKLARDVTDDLLAHRELARLTPAQPLSAFRVGPAAAAAKLRAYYAEGQRRSGIRWQVLAAVKYVESDFGRLRESSRAGALGPMQFLPSTWATYGRGSVHDPHQAILGAARFLHAAEGRWTSARRSIATTRPGPTWTLLSATRGGSAGIRRRFSSSTSAA
jgi:soluble lytic murein transglycosylase-like protein